MARPSYLQGGGFALNASPRLPVHAVKKAVCFPPIGRTVKGDAMTNLIICKNRLGRRGLIRACSLMVLVTAFLFANIALAFRGGTPIDNRLWVAIGEVGSCSGTLIGYDRVLTAAHCVCLYLKNGATHCEKTVGFRVTDDHRRIYKLSGQVYYFPGFRKVSQDLSIGVDLAVIMLDEPSRRITINTFGKGLGYMPIVSPNWYPQPGTQFKLVSLGPTGSQCEDSWTGKNELNLRVSRVEPQLMKFVDPVRGGCKGDSGSPAISPDTHVAGVLSGGNPASGVMAYTLTAPYYNWIMDRR